MRTKEMKEGSGGKKWRKEAKEGNEKERNKGKKEVKEGSDGRKREGKK